MWLEERLRELETDFEIEQIGVTYYALATDWSTAGFTPGDAVEWTAILLKFDGCVDIGVAKGCDVVGITPYEYPSWRTWGLSGWEIIDILKKLGISHADDMGTPSIGFKKFGFDLSEAIQLKEVFFSAETSDKAAEGIDEWDYFGYWSQSRLEVNELVFLKAQFNGLVGEFNQIHLSCRNQIRDWNPNFGPVLSKSLKALRESGLTLSTQNLLKFWGLSKTQILKAIDMGADVDFARNVSFASTLVRSGISASRVKIVEYLMANGIEKNSAIELTKRGFSIGTVEKIKKNGYLVDDLIDAVQKLKPLTVDAVITWLLVDIGSSKHAWLNRIAEWHKFGFTAENAAEWYREEFSANDANTWVKSGAKTPAVAKRRKAAGISPKTVS